MQLSYYIQNLLSINAKIDKSVQTYVYLDVNKILIDVI